MTYLNLVILTVLLNAQPNIYQIPREGDWINQYINDSGYRIVQATRDSLWIEGTANLPNLLVRNAITVSQENYNRLFVKSTAKTSSQINNELKRLNQQHPGLTEYRVLGYSSLKKPISGLKVNLSTQPLPAIRVAGGIHGNEATGMDAVLYLAEYLLTNYESQTEIKELVDKNVVWFIPCLNPDGTDRKTRGNVNNVDLNRDYGYMWNGDNSPEIFSQQETKAMWEFHEMQRFVYGLSFHCCGPIVNYLWNFTPRLSPDDDLIVELSNAYGENTDYWVVQGYNWYETRGDINDWSYGSWGVIDWTIETERPENFDQSDLDIHLNGLKILMDNSHRGLHGRVSSNRTGESIAARLDFFREGQFAAWSCYTQPETGLYWKPIAAGKYSIKVYANGYNIATIQDVTITDDKNGLLLDILLEPKADNQLVYPLRVDACDFPYLGGNAPVNETWTLGALGEPDNIPASMSLRGWMVIDWGREYPTQPDSIFLTELKPSRDDPNKENLIVNQMDFPWNIERRAGWRGVSTFSFKPETSLKRFLYLQDNSTQNFEMNPNPGYDLDALWALDKSRVSDIRLADMEVLIHPNPCKGSFAIHSNIKPNKVEIYNLQGMLVKQINVVDDIISIPAIPAGVYFAHITESDRAHIVKLVVLKL